MMRFVLLMRLSVVPWIWTAWAVVPAAAHAGELPDPETPLGQVIDHYIEDKLSEDGVPPAPPADDATLIRRLTLDLAGRIPTATEAQRYVESTDLEKRTSLVDRLLSSPDYAFHQRNELDAMLMAEQRSDDGWREYLLEAARENRPWDWMFREMMLGHTETPEEPQPEMAFLRLRADSVDDMTNDTSKLFFGVSINCAKCHDHPMVSDWTQDHYYGLASFFDRTYRTKKETLAEKYSGYPKFKTIFGEEKQARFMFLSGTVVEEPQQEKTNAERKAERALVKRQMKDENAPPPEPPDFSPRRKLVEVALQSGENRFFARSIVNRIWARLMGRGLVHPMDQMHSANPASHPELLEWLTRDLITHGYDLKRLIRGIVLSDAYARSSRWVGEGEPPGPEFFAVATVRPLKPRQYALSLLMASADPEQLAADRQSEQWAKRREQLERASGGLAGEFEMPRDGFQVSVDEALFFSNGERVQRELLKDGGKSLVGRLKSLDDRRELIETAFWTVLARPPGNGEITAFETYLSQREDRRVRSIQQIVWALLTSPEFRFNY